MASKAKKLQTVSDHEAIQAYASGCRARVPDFVKAHCTFSNLWRIQKAQMKADLWKLPLNALWAIPYLTLKKSAESLDKAGWSLLLNWVESLPAGFKTSVQYYIEKQIAADLFQVNSEHDIKMYSVKKELKKYIAGRTVVANFSSSLTSLVLGRLMFNKGNLDILGLVSQISESLARDRAASDFIFGKGIGRTFYTLVRPEVTFFDMMTATALFFISLSIVAGIFSLLYFPVRMKLGWEKKKLLKLIDEIEARLILESVNLGA